MKDNSGDPRRQIDALDERLSRLSAAVLRISSSLDLDTVLEEVVDSALALTGARKGTIADLAARKIEDVVISGFTSEHLAEMVAYPDGERLHKHFLDLASPLRVADLPASVQTLGYSVEPWLPKTLLCAPIRYGEDLVGTVSVLLLLHPIRRDSGCGRPRLCQHRS
ncbi:MAG: GAF domain-containing protein [Spirochaetaceae bacterium]|nr:GAF domain-containing protein [Spirochaetaceae bacterium]